MVLRVLVSARFRGDGRVIIRREVQHRFNTGSTQVQRSRQLKARFRDDIARPGICQEQRR